MEGWGECISRFRETFHVVAAKRLTCVQSLALRGRVRLDRKLSGRDLALRRNA
jgi:hypothetical protein